MTDTTNMTESELADHYDRTGDLSEFEGGKVVQVAPGPKDSIVSVRFAASELEAVERQAREAGMKLTAYIRASALSGARVVDLDRLRKVAAKLAADSEEMGKVFDMPTGRRNQSASSSSGRTVARSVRTGNFHKSARVATAKALGQTAAKRAPGKAVANKSLVRPAKKTPPKRKS